jgi:hypothetical protein
MFNIGLLVVLLALVLVLLTYHFLSTKVALFWHLPSSFILNPIVLFKDVEEKFRVFNVPFLEREKLFNLFVGPYSVLCTSDPDVIFNINDKPDVFEKSFFYDLMDDTMHLLKMKCKYKWLEIFPVNR